MCITLLLIPKMISEISETIMYKWNLISYTSLIDYKFSLYTYIFNYLPNTEMYN